MPNAGLVSILQTWKATALAFIDQNGEGEGGEDRKNVGEPIRFVTPLITTPSGCCPPRRFRDL